MQIMLRATKDSDATSGHSCESEKIKIQRVCHGMLEGRDGSEWGGGGSMV